jgi:demethylmenaquinone methyltransferase/2-methoxy-6-polyprenyl-1,4-benzoquinol methylase
VSDLLAEQLDYYRQIANEYEDHTIVVPGTDELLAAIDGFRPTGDILELACGSGRWTAHLAQRAASVAAVDGAPEMLARARARDGVSSVRFLEADLFGWRADRRYDAVFFGFWISHVPTERFDDFWSLVNDALAPGGRVFFFDDSYRPDVELIEGADSPIVERRLNDGTTFRVVKVPHDPVVLQRQLRSLGWDITVTATAGPFYWGSGGRSEAAPEHS